MQRRTFVKTLAAPLVATLAGAPAVLRAQTKNVKIATIAVTGSPWHQALKMFKEQVEAASAGRYTVAIYTDGQLGNISRLLSQMQLGTVEMAYVGATTLSFIRGGEFMNVAYTPYLFTSTEAAERILNNGDFQDYYDAAAKTSGVRLFGAWGQRSPRALQTTRGPILKPDDLKGLKLRVPPIPLLQSTFERLGAQTTPMSMLEIYNAFSRGAIDGQDNGFDLSILPRFHEVAKHWSATDHAYELVGFFVSNRFWSALSAQDREMFSQAASAAGAVTTELTRAFDVESVDILKQAGVQYVVPERAAFAAATRGIEDEFEGKLWPAGLVARIRAWQERT